MVSSVEAAQAGAAPAAAVQAARPEALSERETFLKLLVAQIRNQNPLAPADAIEFVTQLAQFSELEQMIQMRQQLEAIRAALEASADGTAKEAGNP